MNGKQYRLSTRLRCEESVYNKYRTNTRLSPDARTLRDEINTELQRCNDIMSKLKTVNIENFKRKVLNSIVKYCDCG